MKKKYRQLNGYVKIDGFKDKKEGKNRWLDSYVMKRTKNKKIRQIHR